MGRLLRHLPARRALCRPAQPRDGHRRRRATTVTAQLLADGEPVTVTVTGSGNGPIAAFVASLRTVTDSGLDVVDYSEHSLGVGADAVAVAYVETTGADGILRWGVGTDPSIVAASFRAVLSALNRRRSGAA